MRCFIKNMFEFIKKYKKALLITVSISITGFLSVSLIQNFNLLKNEGNITVILGGTNVIAPPFADSATPIVSSEYNGNIQENVVSIESLDNSKEALIFDDASAIVAPKKKIEKQSDDINNFSSADNKKTIDVFENAPIEEAVKIDTESNMPLVLETEKENDVKVRDNDSLHDALLIENEKKYTANLVKKGSEKFYKFTLGGISTVNFSFGVLGETSYKFAVTNEDSNIQIMEIEISRKNMLAQRGNLYLGAGNYFIKITGGNFWEEKRDGNNFKFAVNISTDETAATEAESNNTAQAANIIPINKNIRASSVKDDVDYFSFTLDRRASMLPEMSFTPAANYTMKLYELIVLDDFGGEIQKFIFRGDNKLSKKGKRLNLEAGTYMIRLSRVEDMSKLELGLHEYNLRISVEK